MSSTPLHPNPGASSVTLESVQMTLNLYRSGKSGIPFSALVQFTRPILSYYQLELDHVVEQDVTAGNVDDVTLLLDLFEIASTFWDYCALSEEAKARAIQDLQTNLLGPSPAPEDSAQFPLLLAAMEDAWETLPPSLKMQAPSASVHRTSASDRLDPNGAMRNGASGYGPENMDVPDAFALFARPLLENDLLFADPDALDEVMARAQAYWDLAHAVDTNIETELARLVKRYSTVNEPAAHIRSEALHMLKRFHELFPERG